MTASPKEIREARAFLQRRGEKAGVPAAQMFATIPPVSFAATAKKLGKSFAELLKVIAAYQMGTQTGSQSPEADKFISQKQRDMKL